MSTLKGLGEIALGLLLISPADEIAAFIVTGGASGLALPQQLSATGAAGAMLVLKGLNDI